MKLPKKETKNEKSPKRKGLWSDINEVDSLLKFMRSKSSKKDNDEENGSVSKK